MVTHRAQTAQPRVVLATFGSHGDLHPFLAVALALQQHGIEPVLAASGIYKERVEAEGIEFRHMRPDPEDVMRRLGLDQSQLVRKVNRRPDFLLRQLLLPHLQESYEDSLAAISGADLVITHSAAYGARLAAERLGVPSLGIVLQPLLFMSVFDPPVLPRVPDWVHRSGPLWNRMLLDFAKRLSRRWAAPIDALRRCIDLPPATAHPLFEGQFTEHGTLALYSSVLGRVQPDMPAGTRIVGFACHDREGPRATPLGPSIINFLAQEPRPLVFTLGTSAVHDAEQFMTESLAAVRKLHARAIFVLDAQRQQRWANAASPEVLITGYVPYSLLLPHAAITIHHGGIGTSAQALRSGQPQLVVPHLVDQPDNAARIALLGVGRALSLKNFRQPRIVHELQELLHQPSYRERAAAVGEQVRREDGAQAAAQFISELLQRRPAAGRTSNV